MKTDLSTSFKAYDLRGIVGETITAKTSEAVGAAFVDVLGLAGERVLVGGDMRASSPEFVDAFARGAQARGADVTLLGTISTDMLYFACGSLAAAGVVFTASHNPAQYNGIKFARAGAAPISADTGLTDIRDAAQTYLDAGDNIASVDATGSRDEQDILTDYAQYLRSLVDLRGNRKLTVVVDAANGMAGMTTPAVLGGERLEELPLEIIPLYFDLDGTFPNHPANPLEPDNLVDLQQAVRAHNADLGLAFDGDADRCFVIDERGEPVSPSAVAALVARREIQRVQATGENEPVVIHNLITSRAVPETVSAAGGRAVKTRVGHSYIKAVMAEESAVFGGEHSAHYYFRDFFNADTGMLAALHVMAALGSQGQSLSELAAEFNPYHASGEINSEVVEKKQAMDAAVEELSGPDVAVDTMDGVTLSATDGSWWCNLRPSNTEPYLRFNGEATSAETLEQISSRVLGIIRTF